MSDRLDIAREVAQRLRRERLGRAAADKYTVHVYDGATHLLSFVGVGAAEAAETCADYCEQGLDCDVYRGVVGSPTMGQLGRDNKVELKIIKL